MVKLLLLVFIPLFFLSCQAWPLLLGMQSSGDGTSHTVRNEELRTIMNDLDKLVFEQIYRELERDKGAPVVSVGMAKNIDLLVEDFAKIERISGKLELSQEDEKVFDAIVNDLWDKGQQLKTLSRTDEAEKIEPVMERIVDLCKRCHTTFRGSEE